MTAFICTASGTQYSPSEAPPDACPICTDERQFVPASGQSWTTLERLRNEHDNKFRRLAEGAKSRHSGHFWILLLVGKGAQFVEHHL
jgi:hypothetical protein